MIGSEHGFAINPNEVRTSKIDVSRFVDEPTDIPDGVDCRREAISLLPVESAPIELINNVKEKSSSDRVEVRGLPEKTTMNDSVIVRGRLLGAGAFGEVFAAHAEIAGKWLKRLLKASSGHEIKSVDILEKKILIASEAMVGSEEPSWKRYVLKVLAGSAPDMSDEEWRKQIENELVGHDATGILVSAKIFESREGRRAYALLLDRAPGETLRILSVASEEKKKSAQFQVTLAVAMRAIAKRISNYHKMGWTHRDINPGNLMVDLDVPTLSRPIDFGIAEGGGLKRKTDEEKKGTIGTRYYMTPESMIEEDENLNERDIYALGLSFGEALGMMRILKKNSDKSSMTPQQIVFASATGHLVESQRPEEEMRAVDVLSKYSNAVNAPKSKASKEFFKLLYDIVRPHDRKEDRQAKWARWNNGKGISMSSVVEILDKVIETFINEAGTEDDVPITNRKIDEMETEVREEAERKKAQAFARWRILQKDDPNNEFIESITNALDAISSAKDDVSRAVMADIALESLDEAESFQKKKRTA